MYGFVDTLPGSAQSTSLSLQTIFNGVNLDEALTDKDGRFVTISVGGRGILGRRINTKEMPYQHGSREYGFTYDVREIPVKFLIEDKTNEGFRKRWNRLNGFLLGSKKVLEFTDENAFFIATLQGGDVPDEDSNSLEGTLTFLCTDSAKRMNERIIKVGTSYKAYTVGGHESTPWTSKTVFRTSASQYTLENNNGGKIILNYDFASGDVLKVDYNKRYVELNNNDQTTSIDLRTQWFKLDIGQTQLKSSHETEMSYYELYY